MILSGKEGAPVNTAELNLAMTGAFFLGKLLEN